jgi:hypothetical protein
MSDMYNPEEPSFDGRIPEKSPVWQRLGTQPVHHGNIPVQQRNRELLQVAGAQTSPNVPSPGMKIPENPNRRILRSIKDSSLCCL